MEDVLSPAEMFAPAQEAAVEGVDGSVERDSGPRLLQVRRLHCVIEGI